MFNESRSKDKAEGSKYKNFTDAALIEAIVANDQAAQVYLITRTISAFFLSFVKNYFTGLPVELEEFQNDIYLELQRNNWKVFREFKSESQLSTYLHSIVYRFVKQKYISRGAKENSRMKPLWELAHEVADPSGDAIQLKADLLELIGLLKDREKIVMIYSLAGDKPADIAAKMGTTSNTISILKNRAVNNLKELLKKGKL